MTRWSLPSGVECLVINTGPLISLGRAGALDIIEQLPIRILAPQEVAQEIEAGERTGLPVVMPSWVEVLVLATPVAPVARYLLDLGEAAVIQLALEQGVTTVCIDEWRGRRAAKAVGLTITGSLGLLGRAKHFGILSEVRPWVERLVAVGAYYDSDLLRKFLGALGE